MIGTGIDVRVKVQDIVSSQLPNFILNEAPLTDDFLEQFYISQEFQGGAMDFAANLDQYLKLGTLTSEIIADDYILEQPLSLDDDVLYINTTKGFPEEWGLLKVDNEIVTYTGVTTNSFTGVVRGFSGITSFRSVDNPAELVFEKTSAESHEAQAPISNLSSLFLRDFYRKIKFTYAPGFEDLEFNSQVDVGTWLTNARSFYQSKGSIESIEILFKVLFGETPTVIDLERFLAKPSTAEYSRRDYATAVPVKGNPVELRGKTIYQSDSAGTISAAISEIEPFERNNETLYRIFLFVSNDEISDEKKLFVVPGRTKCQKAWKLGDTTVTVDSTIGFRDNNRFTLADGTVFTYEKRTVNQFLGVTCEDPTKTISIADEIIDDIYVHGFNDDGEEIVLRLMGSLSDIDFGEGIPDTAVNEKIRVDTLGQNILGENATRDSLTYPQVIANSFIYNTSVRFQVIDYTGSVFRLATPYLDDSSLTVGDSIDILYRGSQEIILENRTVSSIDFTESLVVIPDSAGIPLLAEIDIRRRQRFAVSNDAPIDYGNNAVLSNVLNLYDATDYDSNFYVATNSLPSYDINVSIVESLITGITTNNLTDYDNFLQEYNTIIFDTPTEFYTGDLITYSVEDGVAPICTPGEYFIEIIDSTQRRVRLYLSPSFIGGANNVGFGISDNPGAGDHIFTLESQKNRRIASQRTYRKIPISGDFQNITIDRTPSEAKAGTVAVLTNGVEIISYKSSDKVFLGPLQEVVPAAGGEGYDPTSPPAITVDFPNVQLTDNVPPTVVPTRARVTPVVKGKLTNIFIDPQDFDIDQVFSINVVGGNSRGATAIPQIERRNRSIPFDTRLDVFGGGIDPNDETLTFLTDHKLPKGEPVVYNNRGFNSIGVGRAFGSNKSFGNVLSNGGIYYAEPINNRTIRLYPTLSDLNAGINTVGFTSNFTGFGVQSIDTLSKNRLVGATIVEDGGDFVYRNLEFSPENVLVAYDEIKYPNHGFGEGDLVEYATTGTEISGLSTTNSYYVTVIDEDRFKLSNAGIGGTSTDDYDRKDFINLVDVGVGTHFIHYPDITVDISVSYASTISGDIVATPVIRGSIEQVYVNDGGYYGSDIINFQKNPNVKVVAGQGCRIEPVIVLGEITAVQILNTGKNYPNNPDLVITDESGGAGALLRPIVEDGEVVDVVIINGGLSYNENTTKIEVVDTGKDSILTPRIRDLTVNLYSRFGFESIANDNYSVVAYERTIREQVYSDVGNTHSPIIGWANDGNPIYGGFGLSDAQDFNSGFRAMKPSYDLDTSSIYGRPSLSKYPAGFFIEDYKFTNSGDLDTHNGRYCRTPEFPNGVYAYFAGISTDTQSLARPPQFPYFVGPEYRDSPIREASGDVDQDFDINSKPIYRNTFPYVVGDPTAGSEFLTQSYLSDIQDSIIQNVSGGAVSQIDIISPGVDYKVGDIPIFDSTEDFVSSVVTQVEGKEVVSIETDLIDYQKDETKVVRIDRNTVRFYVYPNHDLVDRDNVIISGLSTNTVVLSGEQIVSVDSTPMSLYDDIPPAPLGEIRDIYVNSISPNISIGSSIRVGSYEGELVQVINIFPTQKVLRIKRPTGWGSTVTAGDLLLPDPNYFEITAKTDEFISSTDETYFFNPFQTVGVGTPGDGGGGYEVDFTVGTTTKKVSVPIQAIYAPNHKFRNNEQVTVTKSSNNNSITGNDGDNTYLVPQGNSSNFYVVNISSDYIGLRTDPRGVSLFFTTNGSDDPEYSVETNRFAETAVVERIRAKVSTAQPHQLANNDPISVSVISNGISGIGSNPSVIIKYDDISRSLIVDPRYTVGVSSESNIFELPNHGFGLGDYVLYENYGTPVAGLDTHRKYFVVPFDADRFRLAETFADINPGSERIVNIESVGVGTHVFSLVNPKIDIVRNNEIKFDVSDTSLLGRELKFFYDQTLTEIFESNGIDNQFSVVGFSTAGYLDGEIRLRYSENSPDVLYYGISSGGFISTSDTNPNGYNSITYVDSGYSIKSKVQVIDDKTFTYTLLESPEEVYYDTLTADIKYITSSNTAFGGVGGVRLISSGKNFANIPEFLTVNSDSGSNATLRARSKEIGKISRFRIQNPGWGYSADNTLRPVGQIEPRCEFSDSDFVTNIQIVDGGSGYQNPPNPVLIDSVTREVVTTGSIELDVQSSTISEVIVDLPPSGLKKNGHELFTIDNSNGVPILLVRNINNQTGIVSFSIQTPISGYDTQPFEVGDEVFVENILRFDSEVQTYLDSEDYGYRFFPVVDVTETNPIIVSVQYPDGNRDRIGAAVTFQGAFSSMVNKKLYPEFLVEQTSAILISGERLSIIISTGSGDIVEDTDLVVEESNTNFFKVRGNYNLLVGDRLKGSTSGVIVRVTEVKFDECRYQIGAISRVDGGWNDDVGFLNEEFQVTPNNDYYQNLSYSIKSGISFRDLIGPVNRLVHPAGLKNFSDTRIDGIGTATISGSSSAIITLDFIGLTDRAQTPLRVDRINVFDLGYDNDVNDNRSNAIRFNSKTPNKRLTDYIEVKTNRVLLHDDISGDFVDADNILDQKEYTDFNVINDNFIRAVLQSRNPFTDQIELTEIIVLAYDNNAYTLAKAWTSDNEEGYGVFEGIALRSTETTLRYTPNDTQTFDIDYKLLIDKFVFGSQPRRDIGYARLDGENLTVEPGQTRRIYTGDNDAKAIVVYATVIDQKLEPTYYEFYAYLDGSDTHYATYSFDANSTINYNEPFKATFKSVVNFGRLAVEFTNDLGENVQITTKTIEFNDSNDGTNPLRFKRASLKDGEERGVNLQSTAGIGTAGDAAISFGLFDANLYQSLRTVVYVEGPDYGAIHQIMTVNSNGETYVNEYPFITDGVDLDPQAGIGSFGARVVPAGLGLSDMELVFYPDAGLTPGTVNIYAYHEVFFRELDVLNYRNGPIQYGETESTYYIERYLAPLGQRTNNTRFTLRYKGIPIYEKEFVPEFVLSDLGPGKFNVFNIREHFFSTAEELYYEPGSSVDGPFEPIGIQTQVIGGISTDKMPSTVYAIKRDLNRFSLAATPDDALTNTPLIITNFGDGNSHRIGMKKKLEKSIITIDGVIQSPIAQSNKTFTLDANSSFDNEFMTISGIGTLRIGDLLKVEDEFVLINNIGFGTIGEGPITNLGPLPLIEVERGVVGSIATSHLAGEDMDLFRGSYNIVESDIIFTEAPNGRGPLTVNESNLVEINSSFQGRTFLQQQYDQIQVLDDISEEFDGQSNTFALTSVGSTTNEIENGSGVLIINDIYQTPTTDNNDGNNYFFSYDAITGINSITFTGITSTNGDRVESEFDVNQNQVPRGGLIVSLGSTPGLGYAPLYGAVLQGEVGAGGSISTVYTTNQIGVTTAIQYAEYDNETGELLVTILGPEVTGVEPITDATYFPSSGQLLVETSSSLSALGIDKGDILNLDGIQFSCGGYSTTETNVVSAIYNEGSGEIVITTDSANGAVEGELVRLEDLGFECSSGGPILPGTFPSGENGFDFVVTGVASTTQFTANVGISTIAHTYISNGTVKVGITTNVFPDRNSAFVVESVLSNTSFTLNVGISTISHTYVTGGTFQKYDSFLFGKETNDPNFVYLNNLEFRCPGGQTAGLTTTLFPIDSEAFPVIFLDDPAHVRVLVGVSTINHVYVGGGTIGEYTKNNPGSGYNTRVPVTIIDPLHTGVEAEMVGIPTDGGELIIDIIDPGSGYVNPQLSVPDPQYFNLPVTGVFRRRTGFGTETGLNLFINCTVGSANTTAIGRSEYFQVSNYEITNQGYSFEPGDIIEAVGLVTDKRLSAPIEPFQLTVLDTFTDNFSAWNFGELDYIDSIKPLQDGIRTRFPLIYKGESFSFESNPGDEDSSAIDLDSILLIYVNTVLQVPGESYIFDGGSSFEFTRAPFIQDDIDIYFYRGKRNIDSRTVTEVDESIRPGDELQIKKNDAINQRNLSDPKTLTQDIRTVTEIASSDTVRTNIYFGSGDLETVRPRQVAWDKQKRDVFIYGEAFSKARDSLEPIIQPTASIIRSAGPTATELFVSNADLFKYEESISASVLTNIELNAYIPVPEDFIPAEIELVVSGGSVTGANVINPGQGYPNSGTQVTVASPVTGSDDRASLNVIFSLGSIIVVLISDGGANYDDANPPKVLIEEPVPRKEELGIVQTVQGFTGIITAIEAVPNPAPGIDNAIKFYYKVSSDTQTPSQLISGYSCVINGTFVGDGVQTVTNINSTIVGVGTQGLDAVYQVQQVSSLGFNGTMQANVSSSTDVAGIDTTGSNLGYISWGRLSGLVSRDVDDALAYNVDGSTYTLEMENYPTVIRTTEGLRNEGGLTKRA